MREDKIWWGVKGVVRENLTECLGLGLDKTARQQCQIEFEDNVPETTADFCVCGDVRELSNA